MGANLNLKKKKLSAINFWRELGSNFVIFLGNLLELKKNYFFIVFTVCPGLIKCPVQISAHLKYFVFNERPRAHNRSFTVYFCSLFQNFALLLFKFQLRSVAFQFSFCYRYFLFKGYLHIETKKQLLINRNVLILWNWFSKTWF